MYFLTFDVDWAPEYVLDYVLNILDERELRGVFFSTHPSSRLREASSRHEIAIHPNFHPHSTQGDSAQEIVRRLMEEHSGAAGVRSHGLYWHGGLVALYKSFGLQYDSSLLLPYVPHLQPFRHNGLIRLPIWWNDGLYAAEGRAYDIRDLDLESPGLKIFEFHPIHIFLNSSGKGEWERLKNSLDKGMPLQEAPENWLQTYVNPRDGIGDFFERLCGWLAQRGEGKLALSDWVKKNETAA